MVEGGDLRSEGQLRRALADLRDAVHRLHGRVGEVGEVIGDLHDLGPRRRGRPCARLKGDPLDALGRGRLAGSEIAIGAENSLRPPRLGLGFVPRDLQGVAALARRIGAVRRDRHAGGYGEHIHHARNLARRRRVIAFHPGAKARGMGDHGRQLVRKMHVLCEHGHARGFGAGILAPDLLRADQGEGLGVLKRRVGRWRDRAGLGDKLTHRSGFSGRVRHHTLGQADFTDRDVPELGGGGGEHGPGRGAGGAILQPGIGDGGGPAGALKSKAQIGVELGVGRRLLNDGLGPVRAQFLGDHGGEAGMGALAKFDMLGDHRHHAVGRDPDERAKGPQILLRGADRQEGRGRTAHHQRAGGGDRGGDGQIAAR